MRPHTLSLRALAPLLLAASAARAASPATTARALVDELVACGTRHSLSAWTDPKRGIGCGRVAAVRRPAGYVPAEAPRGK